MGEREIYKEERDLVLLIVEMRKIGGCDTEMFSPLDDSSGENDRYPIKKEESRYLVGTYTSRSQISLCLGRQGPFDHYLYQV